MFLLVMHGGSTIVYSDENAWWQHCCVCIVTTLRCILLALHGGSNNVFLLAMHGDSTIVYSAENAWWQHCVFC